MGIAKSIDLAHAHLILVAMDGSPGMDVRVVTGGTSEGSRD